MKAFGVFLVGSLFVSGPAFADDPRELMSAGLDLLKKGDARADKGETADAVLHYKDAFEKLLPGMRGLSFKNEVKRDVTPREKLAEYLLKTLDDEKSPEEFRADELGMKALGLLPREFKLKEVLVKLYSEEIAAFYDTKTKTMHLIKEEGAKGMEKAKPPGFLEKLMGRKGGFDKDENKTVIAHELTHALADQNFDIDSLSTSIKHDDDRSLAISALVEGEATLSMLGAQMQDWSGDKIIQMPAADLDRIFRMIGPFMMMGGGASLREAPPILAESMLFPYVKGVVFCASLANRGGWREIDGAYKNPPLSTEQVLHPEKYSAQLDLPQALDLGPIDLGKEWKERGRNVLGEMQIAVLLKAHRGESAAAGWDGDAFVVFESARGDLGLLWASTWDTRKDAREFAQSYLRYQTKKLKGGAKPPDAFPDSVRRPNDGGMFAVECRDNDVVIVEGFSPDITDTLVETAFRAKKSEKTNKK